MKQQTLAMAGLAFADAVHLGRVKAVELAQPIDGLALAALGHDAAALFKVSPSAFRTAAPMALALRSTSRCSRPTMVL
jgi:hypothetical protein